MSVGILIGANEEEPHRCRVLSEDMHDLQLAFLNDHVKGVGIEHNFLWVLHVVVDEQAVRESCAELEADFSAQTKLEGFDGVAIDLDERVVLRKHELFVRFVVFAVVEHELRSLFCLGLQRKRRVFDDWHFRFDFWHFFRGYVEIWVFWTWCGG
jgi:hypothetical protein